LRALKFAITIANDVEANILLVYVDKPQSTESIHSKRGKEHQDKLIELMEGIVKKYQGELKGKLEYKIRKGKVYHEMANQAKYSDAYMLVSGTHGISGFEEFWIGSNSYRFVTSVQCPTLTVRENFIWKQKHIRRIVLPIDSSFETRQKVPYIVEMAKHINAEIHVLGLYSSNQKAIKNLVEGYTKQTIDYIEKSGLKVCVQFNFCENITNTTIKYAQEIKADIIAIMNEQEKDTKNILLGPYAQQMVNHSPIPVLSMHAFEIYTAN
jgi:nucleotide-binding universal stress UspA family protein